VKTLRLLFINNNEKKNAKFVVYKQ
jgi:hypothetical protein